MNNVAIPRPRRTNRRGVKRSKIANTTPATVGQVETPTLAPLEVRMIQLDQIELDGRNHRIEDASTQEKVRTLAETLNVHGQQTPVQVYEYPEQMKTQVDRPYLLAFGFRRYAAAELNKWTTIAAVVKPLPLTTDGAIDRLVIERTRGIENLQRLDLNPVEECLLIEQLATNLPASLDGGTPSRMEDGRLSDEGMQFLASSIGRTEAWIRDRIYLARLSPEVKKMVMEGRHFLIYAREIAKLADYADQERVASFAAADPKDGHCGTSIHQVRRFVAEKQNSLRTVPWRLDQPFPRNAAIVGACAGCIYNSSNDKKLFEHDPDPSPEGYCLRQSCFEAKRATTDKAVDAAVTKIIERQLAPTEKSAEEIAAPFVKPGRVARLARKQTEGEKPKAPIERPNPWDSPEYRARHTLNEAERKWRNKADRLITAELKENPGRLTALLLLAKNRRIRFGMTEKEIAKVRDLLKLAAKATPQALAQLEKRILSQKGFGMDDALNINGKELLIAELAGAYGIEIPPFPKLEEFLTNASHDAENSGSDTQEDPP